MRHNIIYLMTAILPLCGCTDWLMVQPRGVEVPSGIEHYEGLLYGTELVTIREVFPYMCFENTCDREGYENMFTLAGESACNAYLWKDDIFRRDEECTEWNFPASSMYTVNVVVNGVMQAEDGTDEEKLAVLSEARMVRAYMHFLMAQFFGKPYDPATASQDLCVPIITTASTTETDFPRRTVEDVYGFILKEMEESVGNLPDRVHHHKRVFRTAGYAMLGKVYWMMGRYEDALEPFGKAIETLRSTSADGIFLDYNSMVSDGRITYPTDDRLNPEQIYNIESMYLLYHAMYPTYYGSTLIYIKPEAMQRYYTDTDDLRLTFISGMESGVSPYGGTFDMNEKYHFEINRIVTNIGITSPDLYLMYAECLARTEHESDAVALLEELRSRRLPSGQAAVPAESSSGDALVKFSLEERMRENLGYGLSWFDMRRLWNDPLFQDMKQMYVHTDGEQEYTLSEQRLVMRIPPAILAWHPDYTDNE